MILFFKLLFTAARYVGQTGGQGGVSSAGKLSIWITSAGQKTLLSHKFLEQSILMWLHGSLKGNPR